MVVIAIYGNGRGKTTSALGLVARALGHDKNVFIFQFMKSRDSGEYDFFTNVKNVDIMRDDCVIPVSLENVHESRRKAQSFFRKVYEITYKVRPLRWKLMIVLDEVLYCTNPYLNLISIRQVCNIIDRCNHLGIDLVLTGHYLPDQIAEKCDTITATVNVKHHMLSKGESLEGVDY